MKRRTDIESAIEHQKLTGNSLLVHYIETLEFVAEKAEILEGSFNSGSTVTIGQARALAELEAVLLVLRNSGRSK